MKKIYLIISILITISILLFVAKPILLHFYTYDQNFDSSIWLSSGSNDGQYTHRQMMINDLTSKILPGTNIKFINRFLGPSIPRDRFLQKKPHFIYLLGKEREIISFEDEWLLIYLDQDKNFKNYEIILD